ncbi:MAG: hypothetical protein ACYDA1_06755, partial [Vulcanimicrobiaceae bacterium]
MVYAYFARFRAQQSPLKRVLIALLGLGLIAVASWYGTAFAVEAVLVALVAFVAALTGFPIGAGVAVLAAGIDWWARHSHHSFGALSGAIIVGVGGILVSMLFSGDAMPVESLSDFGSGQLAFPSAGRKALPRGGDAMGSTAVSISALAAGVREVSSGDFTKNIAVSDVALQELAIALNKLIFGLREFFGQLHASTGQLGSSGSNLRGTASTALAVIEGASVAQGQLDDGIKEQSRIVEEATLKVKSLIEAISGMAASAEEQTRTLDETSLAVSNMATSIEEVAAQVDSLLTISTETSRTAERGGSAIHVIVEGMSMIRATINELATDISQLGSNSEQIGDIVKVI